LTCSIYTSLYGSREDALAGLYVGTNILSDSQIHTIHEIIISAISLEGDFPIGEMAKIRKK